MSQISDDRAMPRAAPCAIRRPAAAQLGPHEAADRDALALARQFDQRALVVLGLDAHPGRRRTRPARCARRRRARRSAGRRRAAGARGRWRGARRRPARSPARPARATRTAAPAGRPASRRTPRWPAPPRTSEANTTSSWRGASEQLRRSSHSSDGDPAASTPTSRAKRSSAADAAGEARSHARDEVVADMPMNCRVAAQGTATARSPQDLAAPVASNRAPAPSNARNSSSACKRLYAPRPRRAIARRSASGTSVRGATGTRGAATKAWP